jgi:hypothetical protein
MGIEIATSKPYVVVTLIEVPGIYLYRAKGHLPYTREMVLAFKIMPVDEETCVT